MGEGGSPASRESPTFEELNSEFTRTGTRYPTHGKPRLSEWPIHRHECGRHMGRVSPELSGAETEHPSRAGASLQGSAALCSLYWGRNLLFLSFSYRLVNHWSKHVLLSRSLPCNFWPCVIVKHFLLSYLWSSQCQVRSGGLQSSWARAPTMTGSMLAVLFGGPRKHMIILLWLLSIFWNHKVLR